MIGLSMIGFTASRVRGVAVALLATLTLSGCATDILRVAPPEASWRRAVSPVMMSARFWADEAPVDAEARTRAVMGPVIRRLAKAESQGRSANFTILALSGGAADGAYGAGVLRGWSESGRRPRFDIVTGVSTGALIAPFAFLGSEYDPQLEALFTQTSTSDLVELAIFKALFGGLGLVDVTPFEREIARHITPELLARVAAEHRRGRRLFIATTNLDARRSVIWDMGEIAQRGDDEALKLFRKVMLASASIPGAFPPVYFDVEIDGRRYQEMHVDGGVTNSVFIAPSWVEFSSGVTASLRGRTTIYVIQNNKIVPNYGPADDFLIDIASTSISEMIRTQARGDQLRIFSIAERNGFAYRVTYVPSEFVIQEEELFDPVYMRALYDVGAARARGPGVWSDEPPHLPSALRKRKGRRRAR